MATTKVIQHEAERLGPYRIGEPLGRGGMGVVYRGIHIDSGREAAIKTVRDVKPERLHSLRREITALAEIHHPGVVRILDSGVEDGLPWYAMELVEGVTLDSFRDARANGSLESTGVFGGCWEPTLPADEEVANRLQSQPRLRSPIEPEELLPILGVLHRIAVSLAFLHGEGLIHRDLKPCNILVRSCGTPVLIDFGLAARAGGEGNREILTEATAIPEGTAFYMAPEQIRGEIMDARADLYSLGCVAYELLTGRPPFLAPTPLAIMAAHLTTTPDPPSETLPWLPDELDRLLMSLLARERHRRTGHADFLATALARLGAEPWSAALPPARPFLYRPALAGRKVPMESLRQHLERARRGKAGLVLLAGESGVGKTRLAVELTGEANRARMDVLVGKCSETARPLLGAFRRPLRSIGDRARERGALEARLLFGNRAATLARCEPTLVGLGDDGASAEGPGSPEAERNRLLDALAETLAAASLRAGLVLIIDDLQWADELTLAFLRDMARGLHSRDAPLLILGTYRSDEVDEGLASLLAAIAEPPIALERLDDGAIAEIVGDMLADRSPPRALVRLLCRHSGGNPFFIAEYLQSVVEMGLLSRDASGRWRLLPGESLSADTELPLPRGLRELVATRLRRLAADERRLLELASVFGSEFTDTALLEVAGIDESEGQDLLAHLVGRRLLEEGGGERLRFAHDRIREVAYDGIETRRRQDLHRSIAEAIRGAGPGSPDPGALTAEAKALLAIHYLRGAAWPRAAHFAEAAGDDALSVHAHSDARHLFANALEALDHQDAAIDSRRDRLRLTLKLVKASWVAEDPSHNLGRLERARSLLRGNDAEDHRLATQVQFWKGRIHFICNDLREAEHAFYETVVSSEAMGDETLELGATSLIGRVLNHQGRFSEARDFLEPTLAPLRARPDLEIEWVLGSSHLGLSLVAQGQCEEGLAHCHRAIRAASRTGSPLALAIAHFVLGTVHFQRLDAERLIETARLAAMTAERAEERVLLCLSHGLLAWAESRLGKPESAEVHLQKARQVRRQLGKKLVFGDLFAVAEAEAALESGRWQRARRLAIRALEAAETAGSAYSEGLAHRARGLAEHGLDPQAPERALDHLIEARAAFESGNARLELARTDVAIARILLASDRARALAALEGAGEIFERAGLENELGSVRRLIETARDRSQP